MKQERMKQGVPDCLVDVHDSGHLITEHFLAKTSRMPLDTDSV